MKETFKTTHKIYTAWNYEKELADLNKASEEGWQLIEGGCFHSRFVYREGIRYRYQLDFRRVEDLPRYIETFREQGWEYINSTFNNWNYFRKVYNPSKPEENYEIFTDRQSQSEMNHRWGRIALICFVATLLVSVYFFASMMMTPSLPYLCIFVAMAIETLFLLRGILIMRKTDTNKLRRSDSSLFVGMLLALVIGFTAFITLSAMRPVQSFRQKTDGLSEPMLAKRWVDFEVSYKDNYFIDVEVTANAPLTVALVNEDGETVYTQTGEAFTAENARVKLDSGRYWVTLSGSSGFEITLSVR